jgi:hypothetical protein
VYVACVQLGLDKMGQENLLLPHLWHEIGGNREGEEQSPFMDAAHKRMYKKG